MNDLLNNILPNEKPYKRVEYLLRKYNDLKNGRRLNDVSRNAIQIVDEALRMIQDDYYSDIIKLYYIKRMTTEEVAISLNADKGTIFRNRKRLIRRLAVILYGDEAL